MKHVLVPVTAVVVLIWSLESASAGAVESASPMSAAAQSQAPIVPRPFPGSSATKSAEPPQAPAPPPAQVRSVPEAPAGAPVYPAAELIDTFDAGLGQRYYLYGTNASYADIVTYYKNVLKNGGRELYKIPPMQQFDLGRYEEEAMAYPPSVVVKDYTWNNSPGYLAVSGTTEKRYKTIIQIVPATVVR